MDDDGPQGREEEVAQSLEDVASSLAHLLMHQFKCYHKFYIFYDIYTNVHLHGDQILLDLCHIKKNSQWNVYCDLELQSGPSGRGHHFVDIKLGIPPQYCHLLW